MISVLGVVAASKVWTLNRTPEGKEELTALPIGDDASASMTSITLCFYMGLMLRLDFAFDG